MATISGQTYHLVMSGDNVVVLEQHPKNPRFWFTAINQQRHIPIDIDGHVQSGQLKFVNDSAIFHAWYSALAEQAHGSWAVVDLSGQVVRATAFSCFPNLTYNWPDKQYLGEVYHASQHDERLGQVSDNVVVVKTSCKPLRLGEICSVCNKEWKRRELFIGTYVGCWCPTEG